MVEFFSADIEFKVCKDGEKIAILATKHLHECFAQPPLPYLEISQLQRGRRLRNNFGGIPQSPGGFLFSLRSNYLTEKRKRCYFELNLAQFACFWSYLSPGFPGSLGLCSHGTLQLNGETRIFAIGGEMENEWALDNKQEIVIHRET